MPRYDAVHYDPPAPVAQVMLRLIGEKSFSPEVQMLIDTGADFTLLPRGMVEGLGAHPLAGTNYELMAFDGRKTPAEVVELDMIFLNKAYRGRYLLIDGEQGILGRDVLGSVVVLLDGPNGEWSQH